MTTKNIAHSVTVVAPGVWRVRLGTPEPLTPLTVLKLKPMTGAMAALGDAACPINDGQIQFRHTQRGCLIEMPFAEGEGIYGLGLQLKSHNQAGLKKTLRVNSDPVADTGDSHAPVPFFASTRGYGVMVDTARYATFYFGSHETQGAGAEPASRRGTPGTTTDELYRSDAAGRRIVIEVPAAEGVDIYLFAGPSLLAAVQRYTLFSGGGCLPPMWGLGIWYRCHTRSDTEKALSLARKLREDRMPCDVFGLEPGWQTQTYSCSYVWSSERFPEPVGLIADLGKLGMRVNLWEHVFVHPTSPLFAPLQSFSGDNLVWKGLVPDLSLPEARQIFADYHKQKLVNLGVSGFKLDECDNSDFIRSPWSFPEHSQFPSGLDGEQMHSLLGVLYQQTISESFASSGRRTYNAVRSGGIGSAPMPYVLYSDLYEHRDFIHGVVNAGFTGLLWSPEVREAKTLEDLYRRVESVIFSHQALINAWYIPNPPWWQMNRAKNNANEQMPEHGEATATVRSLFELRMSLLPYLYSAFARYRFEGRPPIRAMVLDWPDDPAVRGLADQWMFGDNLLVAPLIAGQTERKLYLPQGTWYDFWTRQPIDGGQEITVQMPLDRIPVYVKSGTILPTARPVLSVNPDTLFDITVTVFGDNPEPFDLFEDDGETHQFETGAFNRVKLSWDGTTGHISRQGNYPGQRYTINRWEQIR